MRGRPRRWITKPIETRDDHAANVCSAVTSIFWQHAGPRAVTVRGHGFSFMRHRSARPAAGGRRGDEPGRSASNRILVPGS